MGRVSQEKSRREKIKDGESQKKEDAGARKGREVMIHCVFPMIWGSGGSKSNLAKAAGAEAAGPMKKCTSLWREAHFQVKSVKNQWLLEVEMSKRCTPLWREAHVQVKTYKTYEVLTTFGS